VSRALLASLAVGAVALLIAVPAWAVFRFDGSWGSPGTGAGQFSNATGVAVDPAENVFVADTGNNRIQKFTPQGAYQIEWGTPGAAAGQFNIPVDVAAGPDGSVYVADSGNNRIQRFSTDGGFVSQWGTQGTLDGQFSGLNGVAVGPDGSVYASDQGNSRVQRFLADGTFFASFGSAGSGNGQFNTIRGIAVGPDGTVYVVDSGNNRVQAFTADGTFVLAWGSQGAGDGQFSASVEGIAASADGVYVADEGNARVSRFTSGGTFVEQLEAATSGDTGFPGPRRVAVTPAGVVYATQGPARVGKYTRTGADGSTLPPPQTGESANAQPVRGTVLVKEPGSNRFVELDAAAQIPIGSLVDVRKGEVALTTTAGGTKTQTSRFFEGIFRLLQPKARVPITELRLEGGSYRKCPKGLRAGASAKKKIRHLWGNGSGKFRTKGKYAAASLRGTEWLTEDYCDGTLVRVKKGAVTVRDLVRKKNVVVRAGKSYFAQAKRR
jgi:sugar lactone lactonase YvrE